MVESNENLHGSAPDKSPVALLLVDVINDLEFPEGEQLLEQFLPIAENLARLKRRARQAGIPVVYVNDNFGRWRSDFSSQVRHCLQDNVRGQQIVELLKPESDDYFVLKPKHSGFYCTALELLLDHFGAERLIVAGVAANICVLFTANDAYQRGYQLHVPCDCVASNTATLTREALDEMRTVLDARIDPASEIDWQQMLKHSRPVRS
jgi:nicotinamidase-related amidase